MKFTVLGSGSTGNAVLISTEKTKVLVDAGMSSREILRRMNEMDIDHANLDAILITQASVRFSTSPAIIPTVAASLARTALFVGIP